MPMPGAAPKPLAKYTGKSLGRVSECTDARHVNKLVHNSRFLSTTSSSERGDRDSPSFDFPSVMHDYLTCRASFMWP
jgi:hypothetical protein